MLQDPFAIVVVLFGVILVSLKITDRWAWARKISTVMWILFLAAFASNLGWIPKEADIYSQLVGFAVPFAVCLLLFSVRLADVRNAGKAILVAFAIACVGTVFGVVLASLALEPGLAGVLGADSWRLAGPYTGTYIGGSLNFFALWSGLEIGRTDLFAAANAVDNLTLIPLFAIWTLVPMWLGKRFPVASHWHLETGEDALESGAHEKRAPLIPTQIITLIFLALLVMWVSGWLKAEVFGEIMPQLPTILIVTTLALGLGQFRAVNSLQGTWDLGQMAFYVFFAAVGAMINIYNAIVLSPILFAYAMIVIAVHMLIVYGLGRALRMDIGALTIASAAAKSGPAMVLAVAETHGWKSLALPGVLMGLLGYGIGNYIGFAVAHLVRTLLGS